MQVIVVGAGMGGLAAAIRLATMGHSITVFEQGPRVGGKVNQWSQDGWTFDTGPSLLTMPWVLRDLFREAGHDLNQFLTLDPVDPICRYHFADGTHLDMTTDTAQMAANIEAIAPREVSAFFRFLAYASDVYALAGEPFLRFPMELHTLRHERARLFRFGFRPGDLRKVAAPQSMHRTVAHFFRDPRLRQVFDRYATYNGSSPYRAPATFCLIPFVEFATGAWHPRGGMYRVAEALAALAQSVGVTIQTDTTVTEIVIENRRAVGVRLANSAIVRADVVLSNVDVLTTYERLIHHETTAIEKRRSTLKALEPSYSGFLLLVGTRRTFPSLPHHSIFFSADYRAEFRDLVDHRVPPTDPTIYICRATATDTTCAPEGCDNLFVMVNVPALDGRTDWPALAPAYRARILSALRRRGIAIEDAIAIEDVWTPDRMAEAYGAQRGAIYGFASNSRRAAFLRPPNRAQAIERLYFAGGSAHPGGGVPLALLSGRIAADLIDRDREERAA